MECVMTILTVSSKEVELLVLFPPATVVSRCEEFHWMDH